MVLSVLRLRTRRTSFLVRAFDFRGLMVVKSLFSLRAMVEAELICLPLKAKEQLGLGRGAPFRDLITRQSLFPPLRKSSLPTKFCHFSALFLFISLFISFVLSVMTSARALEDLSWSRSVIRSLT